MILSRAQGNSGLRGGERRRGGEGGEGREGREECGVTATIKG